jgi:hypothetical protein
VGFAIAPVLRAALAQRLDRAPQFLPLGADRWHANPVGGIMSEGSFRSRITSRSLRFNRPATPP